MQKQLRGLCLIKRNICKKMVLERAGVGDRRKKDRNDRNRCVQADI